MRNRRGIYYFLSFGCVLLFAGILWAQNTPDRALIVNGKSAGMVVQMGGHAYVDVETVAQFTNGSVTLEANRVVLTFPESGTTAAPSAGIAPAPAAPPPGLSRNFASLAIAELAEMREWRGAVGAILTYGVPVVGNLATGLSRSRGGKPRAGRSGCINRRRPGRHATPPERIFKPLAMGQRRRDDAPVPECYKHGASRHHADRSSAWQRFPIAAGF